MIVCKFGGSCLTNLNKIQKIREIINGDCYRKIIVVSAVGKDYKGDKKITDLLIELCKNKNNKATAEKLHKEIKNKFYKIISEKSALSWFEKNYSSFKLNLKSYSNEFIISRGEYFTAKIISLELKLNFIDSAKFIKFSADGNFDRLKSKIKFDRLNIEYPTVIPGFYGSDKNEEIRLFNRGGGDTTGAILANFICAKKYENYTDVNGICTANPNIFTNCKTVEKLNFNQCYLMARSGCGVIAKEALLLLKFKKIPLEIINLKNGKSSLIYDECTEFSSFASVEKNYKIIEILNVKKVAKSSILYDILKVFMSNKIAISNITAVKDKVILFIKCEETIDYKKLLFGFNFSEKNAHLLTVFTNKNLGRLLDKKAFNGDYFFAKKRLKNNLYRIFICDRSFEKTSKIIPML